jgi:hypothetical protein
MRVALGVGGLATLSALAAAIVLPPRPAAIPQQPPQQQAPPTDTPAPTDAGPTSIQVERPIQYVQLSPGETAPPGATVIKASAPTPMTVVVTVPAPAANKPASKAVAAPTPIIVKTTQSGKPVP